MHVYTIGLSKNEKGVRLIEAGALLSEHKGYHAAEGSKDMAVEREETDCSSLNWCIPTFSVLLSRNEIACSHPPSRA